MFRNTYKSSSLASLEKSSSMEWFKWPKKKETQSTTSRIYLHDEYVCQHLISMDFSTLVALPKSIERNEWLAMHIVSFAENIGMIYGALSEFCQAAACPLMTIPGGSVQWVDDKNKKKSCSAPQYIDLVMSFTQRNIDDESIFPTKHGNSFPSDLEATLRKLTRLHLHIISHIYQSHYEVSLQLGLVPYLNTVAYHLMSYAKTFRLVEERDLMPLADLHVQLHCSAAAAHARMSSQQDTFVNGSLSPWLEDGQVVDVPLCQEGTH